MPPTPKIQYPQSLDQAVLEAMTEPITVSVSRVTANGLSPVILPPKPDLAPGEGWTKAEIRRLEPWVVTDLAGGGTFVWSIVDAANTKFTWKNYFDPKVYPPRVPMTMPAPDAPQMPQPSSTQPQQNQPPAPQQPQPQPSQHNFIDWPPPILGHVPLPPQQPMQQVQPMTYPQYPPFYGFNTTPRVDPEKQRLEEHNRLLVERVSKLEHDTAEARHKAELDRVRTESDRKIEELKTMLTPKTDEPTIKLLEKVMERLERLERPASTASDEKIRQLEAQIAADRREAEHRAEILALSAKIDALSHNRGPDPIMSMLVDTMKEGQRSMQNVLDGMRAQMLTPRDVVALTKETSHGMDDLKNNMTRVFTDMFDLQRRSFELAMQMQPQGPSTGERIVESVLDKASAVADEWKKSTTAVEINQAKAAAEAAKAQKAAIEAQRWQMEELSKREREAFEQQQPQRPIVTRPPRQEAQIPAVAVGAGLSGPVLDPPVDTGPVMPPEPSLPEGAQVIPIRPDQTRRLGRTDIEWFGGGLEQVMLLREGFAIWIDAVSSNPPKMDHRGIVPGINPEQASEVIFRAVNMILANQVHVPAFDELFLGNRLDDFVMVLLPDVDHRFRVPVIELLKAGLMDEEDVESDEDGNESDDDQEDEQDQPPQPPPPSRGPLPPRQRAPA